MNEERSFYEKPMINIFFIGLCNSMLRQFSGRGNVGDYEDGGDEWLLDGDEAKEWFED